MHPDLLETLRQAQRFGFFGSRPIEEAVAHSMAFVDALGRLPRQTRLVDLGSGGGLPGLVLGDAYPAIDLLLIDRREKRTDFLERATRRLGWHHVTVRRADVRALVGDVADGSIPPFDVVTARGFGPPDVTLRTATALLAPHGRVVISEPPSGDRWPDDLLAELGLRSERRGAVRVFTRSPAV